ncbi:MAG: hypothetical protein ACM32E_11965 [Gemmatimonadota bacterium]
MNDSATGLRFEIRQLAIAIDNLPPRSKAAIFGVCARALAPLLNRVEERSEHRWTVPELPLAIDLVEAFATGSAETSDHHQMRNLLMVRVPDEHPWRTYAQDALICADAGLAAASVSDRPDSRVIHSALDPLIVWMEDRDSDVIRTYGDNHWDREIVNDPEMARALVFLRRLIAKMLKGPPLDSLEFNRLVGEAAVLRPTGP